MVSVTDSFWHIPQKREGHFLSSSIPCVHHTPTPTYETKARSWPLKPCKKPLNLCEVFSLTYRGEGRAYDARREIGRIFLKIYHSTGNFARWWRQWLSLPSHRNTNGCGIWIKCEQAHIYWVDTLLADEISEVLFSFANLRAILSFAPAVIITLPVHCCQTGYTRKR